MSSEGTNATELVGVDVDVGEGEGVDGGVQLHCTVTVLYVPWKVKLPLVQALAGMVIVTVWLWLAWIVPLVLSNVTPDRLVLADQLILAELPLEA